LQINQRVLQDKRIQFALNRLLGKAVSPRVRINRARPYCRKRRVGIRW
jgi:hypothetical protein